MPSNYINDQSHLLLDALFALRCFVSVISRSACGRKERDTSLAIGSDITTSTFVLRPGWRSGRTRLTEVTFLSLLTFIFFNLY